MLTQRWTKFLIPQPKVNDSFEIFKFITSVVVGTIGDFHAVKAVAFINHALHNRLNGKLTVTIKLLAGALQIWEEVGC